ncbi:MAG: glycosyltransferase family 4 protein [Anaerolineae bacterium]
MKVLQVIHTFMPDSQAGSEVYTYLLAKALQQRHEVAVYYRTADGSQQDHSLLRDEYQGIPVYRLVNNFSWSRGPDFEYFDPGQEPAFRRVLDEFRPDVVHFQHLAAGLSTSLPSVASSRGIPTLLHLHDFWCLCPKSHLIACDGSPCPGPEGGLRCAACPMRPPAGRKLSQRLREFSVRSAIRFGPGYVADHLGISNMLITENYRKLRYMARDTTFRRLLHSIDALIAPSRFLKEQFVRWGVAEERIRFVQNGVDPSKFAGLERALPNGPVLQAAFIGQIAPHKGLGVLIAAMNELVDVPIALRIYGGLGGDAKAYVADLKARCKHPRVTFEGPFGYDQVGQVFSGSDVLVVPSIWYENCPMTILEALYAGRPVVTSDIGGMAELVRDGVNGRTFRMGDAHHLAERLRHLAADREALLRYQAGILPPKTMEEVAVEVEGCYQDVLRGAHGAL